MVLKKKRIPWNKGIPMSEEQKRKVSLAKKGKKILPWTKERKKAFSKLSMGKKGTNLGKKFSEEHKNKIRVSLVGHTHSAETRKKIGLAALGRPSKFKGKTYLEMYGLEKSIRLTELNRKSTLKLYESGSFPKQTNTAIEKAIKKELIQRGFQENKDFIHQYKFMNKFMCDFCFPQQKVIVEAYGDFWHANPKKYSGKELHPHQKKGLRRDKSKESYITKVDNGSWTYMYLWESDIEKDVKKCVDKIEEALVNGL